MVAAVIDAKRRPKAAGFHGNEAAAAAKHAISVRLDDLNPVFVWVSRAECVGLIA